MERKLRVLATVLSLGCSSTPPSHPTASLPIAPPSTETWTVEIKVESLPIPAGQVKGGAEGMESPGEPPAAQVYQLTLELRDARGSLAGTFDLGVGTDICETETGDGVAELAGARCWENTAGVPYHTYTASLRGAHLVLSEAWGECGYREQSSTVLRVLPTGVHLIPAGAQLR